MLYGWCQVAKGNSTEIVAAMLLLQCQGIDR